MWVTSSTWFRLSTHCRTCETCTATLGKELCLWDLLALPAGSSDAILGHNVRFMYKLGGAPFTTYVLATRQPIRIRENGYAQHEVRGEIDCRHGQKCVFNDYLSILDVEAPLLYKGKQVLEGVKVTLDGLDRPPFVIGSPDAPCRNKISVVSNLEAGFSRPYNVLYEWNGISNGAVFECREQNCKYTWRGESLVRWFAVDPTIPSQQPYGVLLDAVGQVIEQDLTSGYKSCGNPWSSNNLTVSINGNELTASEYTGTICSPVPNQQNFQIYYTLLNSDSSSNRLSVEVGLGCDVQPYDLDCHYDWDDTGVASCGAQCPNKTVTTYHGACTWVDNGLSDGFESLNLGPPQNDECSFDTCHSAW